MLYNVHNMHYSVCSNEQIIKQAVKNEIIVFKNCACTGL